MGRMTFSALKILTGGAFALSGYLKLIEPTQNFLAVIRGYRILDGQAAFWAAQVIPWAELIFGVFLVLGLWKRISLMALWALNSLFIAALGSVIWRKLPLKDCGCFGDKFSLSPAQMLYFDLALFLALLLLVKREISRGKS